MRNEFDTYTLEHKGRRFTVRHYLDEGHEPPWESSEGHGPIREDYQRGKRPGERVLAPTGSRDVWYLYDWAEAVRIAKRDGWDAPPYGEGTKGQRAARAVAADFEFIRGWLNDDWHYIGIEVTLLGAGDEETGHIASLWGVESCGDFPAECARELADECLYEAASEFRKALHEARERRYWANRGVETRP